MLPTQPLSYVILYYRADAAHAASQLFNRIQSLYRADAAHAASQLFNHILSYYRADAALQLLSYWEK